MGAQLNKQLLGLAGATRELLPRITKSHISAMKTLSHVFPLAFAQQHHGRDEAWIHKRLEWFEGWLLEIGPVFEGHPAREA